MRSALLVLILLVPPFPAGVPVEDVPIAVTIDDLPWIGPPRGDFSLAATDRLLEGLISRGVEATGFVNCDRAEDRDPILQRWLDAGMPLGNHSAGHKDLNSADLAEWTASPYAGGSDRAQKGGAFDRPDYAARCSARKNGAPGSRADEVGFRCCTDLDG